jgi:DNA-binding response OmpR family regulator
VIFEVTLPAAQAYSPSSRERSTPPSAPPAHASRPIRDATILVIEDESLVRKAVQHYLKGAGYRVLTAVDGAGAIEHSDAHDGAIDLILTDLSLPGGGTGPEVALRIQQRRPQAGVLYMTACPPQLLAGRGFSVRADETLQKPFGKEALLARVAEELARAAARQAGNAGGDGAAPRSDDDAED